ncbi:helix-turn-helix domain-containing protein [Bacillus sp. 7884-1]|uniref:helix-turn-helix domain-containing protein n=1 Tax=Bacillus sp. 7884-1 TaxID=2021693 RepID=UPI000BA67360|nr:helix-turn-helix transcriptional regulator [Bacillus sp. 7884-1]PAE44095.1 transcriptional regulator [Bacillus sp. 7884-1]
MKGKIKVLRKKHRDTLKDLSNKINYDYSNLSKIERGIYQPSLDLLKKIANVYNVDMNYFFDDYNAYTPEENKFMGEVDISSHEELLNKYNLVLDGKKLSKNELEFVIEVIRNLRTTFNNENQN